MIWCIFDGKHFGNRKNKPEITLKNFVFFLTISLALISCGLNKTKKTEVPPPSVNNGAAKNLQGQALIYCIVVDSKKNPSWGPFSLSALGDSTERAMNWIMKEAKTFRQSTNIITAWHGNTKVKPIVANPSSLSTNEFFTLTHVKNMDRWADKICQKAIADLGPDTLKINSKRISWREKLVTRLKEKYQTDNIALVFFINNGSTEQTSAAYHVSDNRGPEYAVVNTTRATAIAHETLHLFGAIDLYLYPGPWSFRHRARVYQAYKDFPDDIMGRPYRDINDVEVDELTGYLLGWREKYDKKYERLIYGR